MLRIWGRTNSLNVQKVMWAVGELGLEHERIDAGGAFGRWTPPSMAALNPNRLGADGRSMAIWWSGSRNACVRYLAARLRRRLAVAGRPGPRARADMWMDWMATTVVPDSGVPFWQLVRTPADKRDMPAVAAAASGWARSGRSSTTIWPSAASSPATG